MAVSGQLPLDFGASVSQRTRSHKQLAAEQPGLFSAQPSDIDVHLHSPVSAVASLGGDPEVSKRWLESLVGPTEPLKSRRVLFPVGRLDRLTHPRPPARVTLDAAALSVARTLWASKLGLRPLRVERDGRRIVGRSSGWPAGLGVRDVPWTAIAALAAADIELDVDPDAKVLLHRRLREAGAVVAKAGLAGSAILIETSQPDIVEGLGLPGLAYAGSQGSGQYRLPLLVGDHLLGHPMIEVPDKLEAAIRKATGPVKPLRPPEGFPWTLYPFQAADGGRALRILELAGGVLVAGTMGSGKLTSTDCPVYTERGAVRVGDVRVGDRIFGRDGKLHAVTGVYPQGVRQLFDVRFSDGSSLEVGAEHLWEVNKPDRNYHGREPLVMSTQQLLDAGLRERSGNRKWFIPVCDPVQFDTDEPLPMPGYALGALLGDGSLLAARPTFATGDHDIAEHLVADLREHGFDEVWASGGVSYHGRARLWSIRPAGKAPSRFAAALKELDVWGKRAWEKSVPARYLYAPEPVRRALLQGLLDTAGGVASERSPSSIEFCSTSEQLVDDVRFLVNSLGGTARKSAARRTTYTYNGEKRLGRPSWRLCIQLPEHVTPFRCARKAAAYQQRSKYPPTRAIESITPTRAAEAVCISIDADDELYLAGEHLTVTHNTTISLALAAKLEAWPLLVVSPLAAFSTWARQLGEMNREFYLASEAPAKSWERIEKGDWDALVISYDRLHAFTEIIAEIPWEAVIADELQRIASPGSRRSRALRSLAVSIPRRIGLSGTPLSNKISDVLPLGAFLVPGEWKPRTTTKDLADLYPGDATEAVAEHLGTLMVRRRMEDTGVKLPGKTVSRVLVDLTVEQRRALEDLTAEARKEVEDGTVERMHVFAKLQRMRRIVSCPSAVGVGGPNPKVVAAIDLAQSFAAAGRKTVLFTGTRNGWKEMAEGCERAGLGWVGIWGSSSVPERLEAERRFHEDPTVHVFVGTLQSCAESLTLSPTGTAWVSTDYLYNPSALDQAEARIYRLNTTEPVDIIYLHARIPGGGLDDRFVEILEEKRALIAQVVDRRQHVDDTRVHYSLGDLVYLMTGERNDKIEKVEADQRAAREREQALKQHAKASAHRRKYRNDETVDLADDGSFATILDEVDELLDDEDSAYFTDDGFGDEDAFDV